ncbi:phage replication initiation protein [Janthinobacterium sp. CG_23.3]|uniref:replication initiation factor domain-containing protein n=1 Tax=Janthinobacterium sp. CG_23.3 TaxID=3349634 RepID=UPI0038D439F0
MIEAQKKADAYRTASGGSSLARNVKGQIYAFGLSPSTCAERTASAPALPERIGAVDGQGRFIPRFPLKTAHADDHLNNMWENLESAKSTTPGWSSVVDEDFGHVKLVITDTGESVTHLVRKPVDNQVAFIDWCNFHVSEETFFKTAKRPLVTDDEIVCEASRYLEEEIFGFGVTSKRSVGLNFYRESWVLGDGFGFVCFGGQRATLMVVLNGQGCQSALPGWEKRLHKFLTTIAVRPVLTRVDLAHDDFDGAYLSVDWADQKWSEGGFSLREKGGRPPDIRHLGNWKKPSGRGRTLTIGTRASSKYCRFYEKGKMLGDKFSLWCRCEVERKSANSIIDFDILLNPSKDFVGSYPCISEFAKVDTPRRVEVKAKSAQISFDTSVAITRRQFGKYIRVFRSLFDTSEQLLDAISHPDEGVWPKRLRPFLVDATSGPAPIHRAPKPETYDFVPAAEAVLDTSSLHMLADRIEERRARRRAAQDQYF